MPNNIQKILNDFLEEVKTILGSRLKKIVLYGSYARGDYSRNSDIDIMILTDLSDKEISEYSMKIWEKSADIEIDQGIVISPLLRNIDSFNSWLEVKPFYKNIVNEGVVLVGEENQYRVCIIQIRQTAKELIELVERYLNNLQSYWKQDLCTWIIEKKKIADTRIISKFHKKYH